MNCSVELQPDYLFSLLNINYGLKFLMKKGYTPLQTPQFMLKDYMAKTTQLEQFDKDHEVIKCFSGYVHS